MRKLYVLLALLIIGFAGVAIAVPAPKVILCHHTGSTTNPTVTIEVSDNAVDAHIKNHGDTRGVCNPGDVPQPDPDIPAGQPYPSDAVPDLPNVGADGI